MNWSFSSLMMYESCAYRFKLSKIDRVPEPPRPPNNPLDRGTREHDRLDRFVKGDDHALIGCEATHTKAFVPLLKHAQALYADGKVSAEENWIFDQEWNVCERENAWLWSKLDLNVRDEDSATSVVIDYKTGRSMYKAVEHVQQGQLYAAATALRQPWAGKIVAEFWYLDEKHIKAYEYTREQALVYIGRFHQRAEKIYADKLFRPNPNKVTCKWCPYSPRGNGACPVGV